MSGLLVFWGRRQSLLALRYSSSIRRSDDGSPDQRSCTDCRATGCCRAGADWAVGRTDWSDRFYRTDWRACNDRHDRPDRLHGANRLRPDRSWRVHRSDRFHGAARLSWSAWTYRSARLFHRSDRSGRSSRYWIDRSNRASWWPDRSDRSDRHDRSGVGCCLAAWCDGAESDRWGLLDCPSVCDRQYHGRFFAQSNSIRTK